MSFGAHLRTIIELDAELAFLCVNWCAIVRGECDCECALDSARDTFEPHSRGMTLRCTCTIHRHCEWRVGNGFAIDRHMDLVLFARPGEVVDLVAAAADLDQRRIVQHMWR